MGKHLSTKGIMMVIAAEFLGPHSNPGESFVIRRTQYEEVMFLNVTSSVRRIREFWSMMRLIPGFTAANQNAYVVDTAEFVDWLGIDPTKNILAQLV